jgi:hypothetical protein
MQDVMCSSYYFQVPIEPSLYVAGLYNYVVISVILLICVYFYPALVYERDSLCFPTGSVGRSMGSLSDFAPVGSLFSFSKDWKPTKQLTNIKVSNGLAWSEDKMYYIDTLTKKVDAFDFDAKSGKICKYPCFTRLYKNVNVYSCIINFYYTKFFSLPLISHVNVYYEIHRQYFILFRGSN